MYLIKEIKLNGETLQGGVAPLFNYRSQGDGYFSAPPTHTPELEELDLYLKKTPSKIQLHCGVLFLLTGPSNTTQDNTSKPASCRMSAIHTSEKPPECGNWLRLSETSVQCQLQAVRILTANWVPKVTNPQKQIFKIRKNLKFCT